VRVQIAAGGGQQRRPGPGGVGGEAAGDAGGGQPVGLGQRTGQLLGPQRRQVGGDGGHRAGPGGAGAVHQRGVEPPVGHVTDGPRAQRGDHGGGPRVVGHHHDVAHRRAGGDRGDGVGQQRQHQLGMTAVHPVGQRAQPGLGDGEPLGRHHHRPPPHRPSLHLGSSAHRTARGRAAQPGPGHPRQELLR
jgi:hypothetical protein